MKLKKAVNANMNHFFFYFFFKNKKKKNKKLKKKKTIKKKKKKRKKEGKDRGPREILKKDAFVNSVTPHKSKTNIFYIFSK
jgi:hypothetical protein